MKKDKYPLAGGLIPGSDPSCRSSVAGGQSASSAARDMYSSMNGYMPNGYHSYDPNMYGSSQSLPYGQSSLYGRYDSMTGMYGAAPSTTSAGSAAYMNGAYAASAMGMYGSGAPAGSNSPYGASSMQGSMSPGGHPSSQHSPGSVKSDNGGGVPMPQDSPGAGNYVKREGSPPVHHPPGAVTPGGSVIPPRGPDGQNPQDLNRMISMYLPPGDAVAAAAGDPNAQSRIQSMYAQAGQHYQQAMAAHSAAQAQAGTGGGVHGGPDLHHPGPPMSLAHM